MISVTTALRLRDAGLRWAPARGDRFVIAHRDMDDDVFVLSDMTIEVHDFAGGQVIGFNGTTEWALDSVEQRDAVWLPSEGQLRERLGGAFRALQRLDDGRLRVTVQVAGTDRQFDENDAAEAYGRALLGLVEG